MTDERKQKDDVIIGRNPVSEAIQSSRTIDKVLVARGAKNGAIVGILARAKKKGIPIKEEYAEVEDIFALAEERNEKPFIIVLDEIEDPHNLGAIIRTAECAGAHGVIIPKRRSAALSFAVSKASAGAVEYVPVARVTNIANTLDKLKERGVWVYGADMNGTPYNSCRFDGAVALVIGNEGKGIGRLVREKCDEIVSLPMKGRINSLNASVAAGVLMYAVSSERGNL